MDWVERFYSLKATWLSEPTTIHDYERTRARTLQRLCGSPPARVLELGAGSGGAAAATADLGYDVVAVELSTVRAANARRLTSETRTGALAVVEGDFYTTDPGGEFDLVTYWDGFGVGTDADQRRLLERIATTWLTERGVAIVEVFSPWAWLRDAGTERHSTSYAVKGRLDFDPIQNRFTETVWPEDAEHRAVTQTIRCYSPADFSLLLAGTGLRIDLLESVEHEGEPIDVESGLTSSGQALAQERSYLARLVRA